MAIVDDEAALRARRVAIATAAWLREPADVIAYTRMIQAVEAWNAYCEPMLNEDAEHELLDQLAHHDPPQPLGLGMPGLEAELRRRARKAM